MNLAQILTRLQQATGESFDPTQFSQRLRIQKAVYLLKAFGYEPVRNYSFGSYIRGPYSPELANHYFSIRGTIGRLPPARIPEYVLRPVADAILRGNVFLESAATLHLMRARNPTTPKAKLFEHIRWLKPALSPRLEEAWRFLGQHGLLGPT